MTLRKAGLGPGFVAGSTGGGGGKGGGGGSSTPTTADDTLNSTAFVKILDLLGEGEIEGWPSARNYAKGTTEYKFARLKDIYFDRTPVLRESASDSDPKKRDFNFRDVSVGVRLGTQNQTHVEGFNRVRNEKAVGLVVLKGEPVTRTITDSDVDRVRITLTFAALQKIQNDGDIVGSEVNYLIKVAYNGGQFNTVIDKTLTGRTGDAYQRSHGFALDGEFPVEIRVQRVTDDPSDAKTQNAFSWTSYTEITDVKLTYPNSALIGIQLNAQNFSSIPVRSYRLRGLKVRIPENATVKNSDGSLEYDGIWDGTFQAATWCSDPAWCLWDLLTNCRYGFNIPARDLDKFSFYQASVYCNELVDDGFGGQEPRFSCNVSIQTITEAYKLINDMCSVFRAMPYWSAGSLMVAQDRPSDPVYLFNQTNVENGEFQYTGSSLKTRHSVAVVGYLDTLAQEVAYESVEDPEAIARFGIITAEITAFACTSRSQAYRLGEWLLYTEQYENETVTFKATMDSGIAVRPGMIVAISDPARSGLRRGGRITAAGNNFVTIDEVAATNLPVGDSPQILVALSDGTVATKAVTSISGPNVNISGTFAVPPLVGGVFIYNDGAMSSTTWRILGIQEQNGTEYTINAVSYDVSKYDFIERGRALVRKSYPPLTVADPIEPTNASTTVATYEADGQLQNKLLVDWQGDPEATEYEVSYRVVSQ